MNSILDKIFIPGGRHLGDQFVMTGIINHWADLCGEVHYSTCNEHKDTLTSLFREQPNIKLIELNGYHDEIEYIKSQGGMSSLLRNHTTCWRIVNGVNTPVDWDLELYESYNLPFSMRYTNFRCPVLVPGSNELFQELYEGKPYILLHRRSSEHPNGLPVDYNVVRRTNGIEDWPYTVIEIVPGRTPDMMQYLDLIKNATEIHCIDSSFFCLVDSVYNQTKANLYIHDIRAMSMRRFNYKWNNYRWNIIRYSTRF